MAIVGIFSMVSLCSYGMMFKFWDEFCCSVLHFFHLTSRKFQGWPPHSVTIVLYNWGMLLQSICLKDLRMRPSIEFVFLDADAVWCLKESSLSIHTPKSFSRGFFWFVLCG